MKIKAIKSDIVNKYFLYKYSEFTQPALTSDGAMGSSAFAVSGETNGGTPDVGRGSAYSACYPQTGSYNTYTKGGSPYAAIILYTPNPTLITQFTYKAVWDNAGNVNVTFSGSNNGVNWSTLYPTAALAEGTQTITITNSSLYKYYKLNVQTIGGGSHDGIKISGVRLFGNERTTEEGSEDNYDYFTTEQNVNAIKIEDKFYVIRR